MKYISARLTASVAIVFCSSCFCGCSSVEESKVFNKQGNQIRPIRILCIGDSITHGGGGPHGGFRGPLQKMLTGANLDYELNYDANGGRRLVYMLKTEQALAKEALAANPNPDIILLLVGINDLIVNRNTPEITLQRMGLLLDELTEYASGAKIIVGNLVPDAADDPVLAYEPGKIYVNSEDKVLIFNRGLPLVIKSRKAAGLDVDWVNFHCRMTRSDLADGIHPNNYGYEKMASVWFGAVKSHVQHLRSKQSY